MAPRISMPSQYQAPATSIRRQGGYPICWAFGATSAVETNVLRKNQGTAQPNGNSAGSATILPYGGISPNVSSTQSDYSEANFVYSVFNTYAGKNDAFSLDYGGVGNSYRNITCTITAATGEKPRQPSPDGMAKPMKRSTRTRPNSAPPTPMQCTSGASAPPDNPNCTSPTSKNCQRPTARQVGGQRRALLLSRGRRQRIELQRDLQ